MINPLVHRGFSISTVKLHDELTPQELAGLTREEKDAMNALMIGMNNIGVLAKNGHLNRFGGRFRGVYVRMFASRWRRVIQIFMMRTKSPFGRVCFGCWTIWRAAIQPVVENGGMTGGDYQPSIDVWSVRHSVDIAFVKP